MNTRKEMWAAMVVIIVALCLAVASTASAESNHHVELDGIACRSEGRTTVRYSVSSWTMSGDAGLNPAVKLEYQYTAGNLVSGFIYVTTGAFTDPDRAFSGEFVIDRLVDDVKLVSTVMSPWGNGYPGGQVNANWAQVGDCYPEPTTTTTPIAPSATPSPTVTRAWATSTMGPTASPTATEPVKKETSEPPTATPTITPTSITVVPTSSPTATSTSTHFAPPTATIEATPPCNNLPDCAPTNSEESDEGYGLKESRRYQTQGNLYVVYRVICPEVVAIELEIQFTEGGVYRTDSVVCGGEIYVPMGSKVVMLFDAKSERVLLRKELPPEISDPPSVAWLNVYLPLVNR